METAGPYDVVVVGGGPGGSSAATFIAKQGHRVLLLERERFPRYQIGESLLPATVHGICALLGVKERLEEAGFVRKLGGTFRWGSNAEPWTFQFGVLLSGPTAYAYQVERSRFDEILLTNARRCGVEVRQGQTVVDAVVEDGRVAGVTFRDARGRLGEVRARFVVDASGYRSRLAARVGERVFSRFFRNVALFGYYHGGRRLEPPFEGNILSVAFREGWFWYIPLSETLTSVGAVVDREHAGRLRDDFESAMADLIERCPMIKEYLAGARRVTEGPYGELRVRKDYSYSHSRFWRPGLALVGDAACFVDPVFSSGVHLATYAGLLAARSINTVLAGTEDEERCFTEFEQRYRREYSNFYQFLLAFYDMNRDETSYFWAARKVLATEEADNEAFVRLVAGVAGGDEILFGGARSFFTDREGIGEVFQGLTEGSLSEDQVQRPGDRFDPARLFHDLRSEVSQVQLQARLGAARPREQPLHQDGLVPSSDGLHWVRQEPEEPEEELLLGSI